jgi:calpain-15
MSHASHKKWEGFVWKRPAEVYGEGNFSLFDHIDVNDIHQGYCGDCYFLSSVSSIAEFPDRIKRIFITDALNSAGCYAVTLHINGESRTVVVDDRFPYCPKKETWAFSRPSKTKEIWVLILEKVWAKVYGSYQRIESGNTGEALHPLTGCPTKYFMHSNVRADNLWSRIHRAEEKHFVMCCAVASAADPMRDPSDMKAVGLVDGHAYSLLGAKTVSRNGVEHRILKVRNPWGRREW